LSLKDYRLLIAHYTIVPRNIRLDFHFFFSIPYESLAAQGIIPRQGPHTISHDYLLVTVFAFPIRTLATVDTISVIMFGTTITRLTIIVIVSFVIASLQ
jgi:hypothetical protein